MARFERAALLKKFHEMAARGEPIVGGGAGTGASGLVQSTLGVLAFVILFGAARGAGTLIRPALLAHLYGRAQYASMKRFSSRIASVKSTIARS